MYFGGSGRMGPNASRSYVVEVLQGSFLRSLRAHRRGLGESRKSYGPKGPAQSRLRTSRPASHLHCKLKLNLVEPPRYATRMPGGVGGAAPRGTPLSRSITAVER